MLPDSASADLPVMQECRRAVEDQRAEEERSEDESITKALVVFLINKTFLQVLLLTVKLCDYRMGIFFSFLEGNVFSSAALHRFATVAYTWMRNKYFNQHGLKR